MLKIKLKKFLRRLSGRVAHLSPKVERRNTWCGSDYGGFYVSEPDLSDTPLIYSFGIGEDISFDRFLIDRFDSTVFGFDPTPRAQQWLTSQDLPTEFNFRPYGIAPESGVFEFNLPKNKSHVSGSLLPHHAVDRQNSLKVSMKSFGDICDELGHSEIDIVKMDIEGSEYEVLPTIVKSEISVRQILVEFHDRFWNDSPPKSREACKILADYGYEIFAVSDSFQEVSFVLT